MARRRIEPLRLGPAGGLSGDCGLQPERNRALEAGLSWLQPAKPAGPYHGLFSRANQD